MKWVDFRISSKLFCVRMYCMTMWWSKKEKKFTFSWSNDCIRAQCSMRCCLKFFLFSIDFYDHIVQLHFISVLQKKNIVFTHVLMARKKVRWMWIQNEIVYEQSKFLEILIPNILFRSEWGMFIVNDYFK